MYDMPSFRAPDGGVWVWDPDSKTYVLKPTADLPTPDRGHAFGGDADLFSPNQLEHSILPGVPELEGIYASNLSDFPSLAPDESGWLPPEGSIWMLEGVPIEVVHHDPDQEMMT